jgi:hypothetical protein
MLYSHALTTEPDIVGATSQAGKREVAMFEDKTKVLLMIPQGLLDQARVFAGEALIDEGLKRDGDRAVFANVEAQVQAVRQIRSRAGRDGSGRKNQRMHQPGVRRSVSRRTLQAGRM